MPHPIDIHVGAEIARRRIALGLNQSDLGRALGLTFQQIQKYEKGSNRVSASKLHGAAQALGCSIGDFFPGEGAVENATPGFFTIKGAAHLAAAYAVLPPATRRLVLNVANAFRDAHEASAADDGSGFDYLDDERPEAIAASQIAALHA